MEFDELYFCGVPAVKWYANKYPHDDITTLENIKSILQTIKTKKIILISTIDVYESVNTEYNEDHVCNTVNNHTYGKNRYLFEIFVKEHFENHHIIRLPALFGKGLKKNIIYDLITNNSIENISKNTYFQWYDLDWLKNDIDVILKNNITVCNLFTEPLSTFEIIKFFNYPIEEFKNQSTLIYNTKTKYSKLFNSTIEGYIRGKSDVLDNLKLYLNFQKKDKSHLVVSNICVKTISQFQFANVLKLFGIHNVQIAPTTLIDKWDNLSSMNLDIFKNNNINVYSFQSITFGLNDLNIFDSSTSILLLTHLKKVIDCGILQNVKVFVFGCPKNRKVISTDEDENTTIFCKFFRDLGDYIGDNELTICIEPNSSKYGCNYINNIKEAGELVKIINRKNIKMMVDSGNMLMENDDLNDIVMYKEQIYNIDIANENMVDFRQYIEYHSNFIKTIRNINYNKKINLEMLIRDSENELEILCKSLYNFIILCN
jgi:sugar phosphate isomerase/epimerase